MQLKQEIFILFCLLLGTGCIIVFKSVLLLRKLSAKCNMIAWKNSLFSRKCIISKNLQNWKWNINVTFLVVCGCSTSKSSKENIVWIISEQIYFENMTRIILGFLVKWQCGSSIMVVKSLERMRHYLWRSTSDLYVLLYNLIWKQAWILSLGIGHCLAKNRVMSNKVCFTTETAVQHEVKNTDVLKLRGIWSLLLRFFY